MLTAEGDRMSAVVIRPALRPHTHSGTSDGRYDIAGGSKLPRVVGEYGRARSSYSPIAPRCQGVLGATEETFSLCSTNGEQARRVSHQGTNFRSATPALLLDTGYVVPRRVPPVGDIEQWA